MIGGAYRLKTQRKLLKIKPLFSRIPHLPILTQPNSSKTPARFRLSVNQPQTKKQQTMSTERPTDLPQECWELIFNSLRHERYLEPLSLVSTRFLSIANQLRRALSITNLSSPFISSLINRFPNVNEIDLSDFNGDLDSVLLRISESGLDLDSLDLSRHTQFPLLGLRELGLNMRNLRKLNCSKLSFLQDSDLFVIGNSFPLLQDLDISYPQYVSQLNPNGSLDLQCFSGIVTDEGILHLSLKLKKLLRIDISGNHFITDQSLTSLCTNCVLLRDIVICDCNFITDAGIGLMLRNGVNFNAIWLNDVGIPSIDPCFKESFAYAKNLCEVCLSDSFLSDELLYVVAEACLPLKKLILSHCYNFSFVGISYMLQKYRFMQYLDLQGANFLTDQSIIELSRFLGCLNYINLNSCSKLTSLTFFALLRNCPLLNHIKMENTNLGVGETMLDFIVDHRVKSLNLTGNNCLSDECLQKIAICCPDLEVLEISYCPTITEEGIRDVLMKCSKIRQLNLQRCRGIRSIDLDFELHNLEVLKAQGPGIDNEALAVIAKRCPRLLYLDLEGCSNVTAEGVNEVAQHCRFLKKINLKFCDNVKADIVAYLAFLRPSLRRIIPPPGFTPSDKQISFFLRHGCLVCTG